MRKVIFAALAAVFAVSAAAQTQKAPEKKSVAVVKISPTEAVRKMAESRGEGLSLEAVAQALEADVSSALQNARKFEVLTRSDSPRR